MSAALPNDDRHLAVPQTPSAKTRFDGGVETGSEVDILDDYARKSFSSQTELEVLRRYSASPLHAAAASHILVSPLDATASSAWHARARRSTAAFWVRNKAVLMVGISQFFGALMNLAARLLELEGEGMHPFQVLFARQSLTMLCCCVYMYVMKVPAFPFGEKGVRWLLVARGLTGFWGIYGLWYSMLYLPLAEATVLAFLAPSVAGYVCHVFLHEPFTRVQQIASFVALGGVVLIAHPASLFAAGSSSRETGPGVGGGNGTTAAASILPGLEHEATVAERLSGIGMGMVGVLGAAGAYTTIRWIGTRTHPLISVNYFATWSTIVCTVILTAAPLLDIGQPSLRFLLPGSPRQWFMLIFLGVSGFIMQFLMTSGLGRERSNRANAMVYTHILFAAGFDRWIFGHEMGLASLTGCGLIIGSALWAVLSKETDSKRAAIEGDVEQGSSATQDPEGIPMMFALEDSDEEEENVPLQELAGRQRQNGY